MQRQLQVGTSKLAQLAFELWLVSIPLMVLVRLNVHSYLTYTPNVIGTAFLAVIVVLGLKIEQRLQHISTPLGVVVHLLNLVLVGVVVYGSLVLISNLGKAPDDVNNLVRTITLGLWFSSMFIVLVASITRILCLPEPDDEDEKDDSGCTANSSSGSLDEASKPPLPANSQPHAGAMIAYVSKQPDDCKENVV